MKIQVENVTGTTSKKGFKQNKVYTVISQGSKETILPDGTCVDLSMFYEATDGKRNFTLMINDGGGLAIKKSDTARYSHAENFTIIND